QHSTTHSIRSIAQGSWSRSIHRNSSCTWSNCIRRNQAGTKKKLGTPLSLSPMVLVLTGLQLPWWIQLSFFSFWAFSFILDVKITISCNDFIKYETNFLFRFLVRRFGTRRSIALQALAEIGLIISSIFGLAHIMAWQSNKRFLTSKMIESSHDTDTSSRMR